MIAVMGEVLSMLGTSALTQQSFKASSHWMHGLWQPVLTFSTIMALNPGEFLLILSL